MASSPRAGVIGLGVLATSVGVSLDLLSYADYFLKIQKYAKLLIHF